MMHGTKPTEPPAVAIDGVSHCYGARQALDDVTFSIAPATFAVLLGLNGAGKSTLFSLMTRLYAVQRGDIRVFGYDIRRASSEALRMVGVVFQQPVLIRDTVLANLTLFHPEATQEEVVAAARAGGIDDTIAAMPDGYATVLGEAGRYLRRNVPSTRVN